MSNNHVVHENAPQRVAYDFDNRPYYSTKKEDTESLIRTNGGTLFAGETQVTLFMTSFALAMHMGLKPKKLRKREANIPLSVFGPEKQWIVLAMGLAKTKDLLCLKNEDAIYKEAEEYANAGFTELRDKLKLTYYPAILEKELLELAEDFIRKEKEHEDIEKSA